MGGGEAGRRGGGKEEEGVEGSAEFQVPPRPAQPQVEGIAESHP